MTLLTGRTAAVPGVGPEQLRAALESALLPVFAVLLALAVVNLAVAASFPRRVEGETRPV